MNIPKPLSKPHPPILTGGEGERKTLRLVAKYGDACNFNFGTTLKDFEYPPTLKEFTRRFNKLREYCRKYGRRYDEIEPTALGTIRIAPRGMSPEEVIALCTRLARVGIKHTIFNLPNVHDIDPIEIIGREIIPNIN